jgi:hypothetical protein
MTHPIGYFSDCIQAQRFADRFGDFNLQHMQPADHFSMLAILGQFLYQTVLFGEGEITLLDAAADSVHPDDESEAEELAEAVALLEGITAEQAVQVIQFIVQ